MIAVAFKHNYPVDENKINVSLKKHHPPTKDAECVSIDSVCVFVFKT